MSLTAAAARLGVDPSTLSRWERGVIWPTGPRADAYLALMARLDGTPPPRPVAHPRPHADQMDIFDMLGLEPVPA